MKRTLLLGLACTCLHAGMSLGQEAKLPPAWVPPPVPLLIQDGSTPPPPAIMDEIGINRGSAGSRPCGPRVWADAEFLLWWTKRAPVNTPLVTEATNPADPTSGQIGSANTAVLLGDRSYAPNQRYGGRFTLGGWFDSEGFFGLEGTYLFIAPQSITRTVGTSGVPGSPTLAIPFFDVTTGMESANQFAGPGPGGPGGAYLRLRNQLQGGELNLLARLIRTENLSITGIGGFRYVNFNEELDFGLQNSAPAFGHLFSALDSFRANNNFYGGQLGLRGDYQIGNFFVEATGKFALGSMQQTMDITGASTAVNPGFPAGFNFTNAPGGTFAQPTNIGVHNHNVFCVMPEAELKFGYNITRYIQLFAGYNFLYLNNVVRPGAELDHNSNPTQVPFFAAAPATLAGPPAPNFSFSRSDFWAQGVNFGLQFKF